MLEGRFKKQFIQASNSYKSQLFNKYYGWELAKKIRRDWTSLKTKGMSTLKKGVKNS